MAYERSIFLMSTAERANTSDQAQAYGGGVWLHDSNPAYTDCPILKAGTVKKHIAKFSANANGNPTEEHVRINAVNDYTLTYTIGVTGEMSEENDTSVSEGDRICHYHTENAFSGAIKGFAFFIGVYS